MPSLGCCDIWTRCLIVDLIVVIIYKLFISVNKFRQIYVKKLQHRNETANKYSKRGATLNNIVKIYISPDKDIPMHEVMSATLIAEKGIVGDRYFDGQGGTWTNIKPKNDRQISIVNLADINAFAQHGIVLNPQDLRRNVLVEVPDITVFMNQKFFLGNTVLITNRYSHACALLEKRLNQTGIIACRKQNNIVLGINCQILYGGDIKPGDKMRLPETQAEFDFINSSAVCQPKPVKKG